LAVGRREQFLLLLLDLSRDVLASLVKERERRRARSESRRTARRRRLTSVLEIAVRPTTGRADSRTTVSAFGLNCEASPATPTAATR